MPAFFYGVKMRIRTASVLTGVALFGSGAALVADGEALAKQSGCLACHAVANKKVGPAFKDVAAKYRGDAKAKDRLIKKVRNGGAGVWGKMAMPANKKVSDKDLQAIVTWVLAR